MVSKYAEAESLFKEALSLWKRLPSAELSNVAPTQNNLGLLYSAQGRYAEAEPLFKEALSTWERVHGPEHPDVARTLTNLAKLYRTQGRYAEAEPLFKEARIIREKTLEPDHPDVAQTLAELARLYTEQGCYAEAEPLFLLALDVLDQAVGAGHASTVDTLKGYAQLLEKTGVPPDSDRLAARIRAIQANRPHKEIPGAAFAATIPATGNARVGGFPAAGLFSPSRSRGETTTIALSPARQGATAGSRLQRVSRDLLCPLPPVPSAGGSKLPLT